MHWYSFQNCHYFLWNGEIVSCASGVNIQFPCHFIPHLQKAEGCGIVLSLEKKSITPPFKIEPCLFFDCIKVRKWKEYNEWNVFLYRLWMSPLHFYIDFSRGLVDWVLWHINHYKLFNAKSCLYTYILNIWFVNVQFVNTFF